MIETLVILAGLILGLILWFFLFPVKYVSSTPKRELLLEPPDFFIYSYVLHIHTQFSYDSLGKPEDVIRTRDKCGIDYAIVTDHDNELIKDFCDERLIVGKEVKLNDSEGRLQGDLLEIKGVKVVAHPFREKYKWRLEKDRYYLLELIDLRDALLEKKLKLTLYILLGILLYPLMGKRLLKNYAKLVDIELYVKKYFQEGWRSKVVGGLDHHVKLYLKEVKKRIMVPDYQISFSLLRNFLLSRREIKNKENFLKALCEEKSVICFGSKPALVWTEGNTLKAYSPYGNTYMKVCFEDGSAVEYVGSNLVLEDLKGKSCLVLGYTYALKVGRLLLGVRPFFVSDRMEVIDAGGGEAPS